MYRHTMNQMSIPGRSSSALDSMAGFVMVYSIVVYNEISISHVVNVGNTEISYNVLNKLQYGQCYTRSSYPPSAGCSKQRPAPIVC